MRKGLAILLVLGVLAQEDWTLSAAPAISDATAGANADIASKKHKECNNLGSKSVNRKACQRQNGEKNEDVQRGGEERKKH